MDSKVPGATAAAMRELSRLAPLSEAELEREVNERLARHERLTDFGHWFHDDDPRATTILELADERGCGGRHLSTARRIEAMLRARYGLALNIAGANAAILLDLGFDPRIAQLFIVLGRSAMFAAIYLERLAQERRPFPRIEVADVQ
jgi:citrate synthase/citryl-CoA lyase